MQPLDLAKWFEPLPEQCPPSDATAPNGVFYRLSKTATVVCEDFWSARKLDPMAVFNASECIAIAISVYSDTSTLCDLKKLPRHKSKAIVAVKLRGDVAGRIKKTGKDKYHHSWWRPAGFQVLDNIDDAVK